MDEQSLFAQWAGKVVFPPHTLALDRTNWKVGAVDLNILMLSIVYRGVGIPVVWTVLSKAGNSDTSERTTVIEIFLDLFGAQNIACLLGDREFVGREWLRFLKKRFPPRPRYLAPLSDQLRALRCCCLAGSYKTFVL